MDYLSDIKANYGHLIHSAYYDRDWQESALERLELLIYDSMFVFTILMGLFFCLFVYYCIFGFVVGAISGDEIDVDKYTEEQKQKIRATEEKARDAVRKGEEKVKAWW